MIENLLSNFNLKIDEAKVKLTMVRSALTNEIRKARIQHMKDNGGTIVAEISPDFDSDGLVKITRLDNSTYETKITLTLKSPYLKKEEKIICSLSAHHDGNGVKIQTGEWTDVPVDPQKIKTYLLECFNKKIDDLDIEADMK